MEKLLSGKRQYAGFGGSGERGGSVAALEVLATPCPACSVKKEDTGTDHTPSANFCPFKTHFFITPASAHP